MKPWKYRGHYCIRSYADNAQPYRIMFYAYRSGKEVAKAFFKADLHNEIDLLCDGLKAGTGSVTTATETAPGPSASTA